MDELQEASKQLGETFQGRAHNQWLSSLVSKISLALFTAISVGAQFTATETLNNSSYVGIGSAVITFIIALFIVITEKDTSKELVSAMNALEAARKERAKVRDLIYDYRDLFEYQNAQVRSSELYQGVTSMSTYLEETFVKDPIDIELVITNMLDVAKRSLSIAMGYQTSEHYTLCVYRTTVTNKSEKVLRCIAHTRTVNCALSEARQWPTGVGVAGAALARGNEIVVPDMNAIQIGSLYAGIEKDYDAERYRSIAAVPILAAGHNDAWGVVVGTSDRVEHFKVGLDQTGVQTVEAVRALAAMAALAVRADQLRVSCGNTPELGSVTDNPDV